MNLNIWWHTVVRNQPATEWTKLLLPNDIMLSSDYSWIIFNLLSYHLIRRHLDSPMPIAAEMPDKYMKEQWICVTFIQEQMFPVTKLRNMHHNWWDINLQSATEHSLKCSPVAICTLLSSPVFHPTHSSTKHQDTLTHLICVSRDKIFRQLFQSFFT